MRTGAYLYPWDVDGDPAAADRIAGLGLTEVTLAAAYHAVRAVTPFHPEHRIVTRDAGVYYRPDPARWARLPLRPPAGASERSATRSVTCIPGPCVPGRPGSGPTRRPWPRRSRPSPGWTPSNCRRAAGTGSSMAARTTRPATGRPGPGRMDCGCCPCASARSAG